jgi:hypothetical protein
VKIHRETTREEDQEGRKRVREVIIQNEGKLMDLANLKDDQETQHIREYGNKEGSNSTQDESRKLK